MGRRIPVAAALSVPSSAMKSRLWLLLGVMFGLAGCVTDAPPLEGGRLEEARTGAYGAIRIPPGGVVVGLGQDSAYYALDTVDGLRRGLLPRDAAGNHYVSAGTRVLTFAVVADAGRGIVRVPLTVKAGEVYEPRHEVLSDRGKTMQFWLVEARDGRPVSQKALLNFGKTVEVLYRPDDDNPGASN